MYFCTLTLFNEPFLKLTIRKVPKFTIEKHHRMNHKLLLVSIGMALGLSASAQCSVDTIPDAFSNSGQCYIDNVTVDMNSISLSSGFQASGTSYQAFPSPYINLYQGQVSWFDLSIVHSTFYSIYAWIDYNNDGIYGSTEIAFYDPGTSNSFIYTPVSVPLNTLPDTVHMRITVQQNGGVWGPGADDACEAPGIGETEDYMVIIQCAQPQPLSFDQFPVICYDDSVQLSAFSSADVAWYTGSPMTLQTTGTIFYLHTPVGTTDTTVYLQFASPGCFSAPVDSMMITFMPTPEANILGPDTIQSCSTVTISATPGPDYYSWNTGDTGSTITISSGFGGMLSLAVTATNGCYDNDQIFVQIAPDPPATYATVIPGSNFCSYLEVYMNYDSLIAPGTCTWYTYPGNTVIGSGSQIIYTLPDTGTFQFLAIVNSICGTDTIIRTIEGYYGVEYDSMYVVDATYNANIWTFCYSNTGMITGVLAGLQGTVDQWILTDETIGFTIPWNDDDTLQLPSSMATVGHIYSAYAVVLNAMGCYDTTETIYLTPQNTMNFNLSDTAWLCSFPSAFGYGAVNYAVYDLLWSTGDTTNTIQVPGPMSVTIYAIDNNTGCVTNDTAYIGDASAQANLFSDTTFACSGSAYFDPQLSQYTVDYWEEFDLNWSMNNTTSSSDYYVNGSVDVYLVFNGYNSHACYIHDTTYVAFSTPFTFSLGADISTMITPVALTGPSGNGFSYTWAPVSSSNQSIQVSTSGTYSLTVNNGQGCVYTDVIVVNILPTATQESSVGTVNVYPNPANEMVTVQSSSAISQVNFYDLDGRLVATHACNSKSIEIDIAELPAGCYILEAVAVEGIQRSRLVKQQ